MKPINNLIKNIKNALHEFDEIEIELDVNDLFPLNVACFGWSIALINEAYRRLLDSDETDEK